MSLDTDPGDATSAAGPRERGVGMRVSLHPHRDDFVDLILGALDAVEASGLTDDLVVETDDVSTYVAARSDPAEQVLAGYLVGLLDAASDLAAGGHVVAHVLLSRGCPGEVTCELDATTTATPAPVRLAATGRRTTAHWSLYPLLDGSGPGGDHMAHIESAVAAARRRGSATTAHYTTRLEGDLAEVVATAVDAWADVGTRVQHVVTHLTLSLGSPSPRRSEAAGGRP